MVSHNYCKMVQLFEGRFYNSIICIINFLISTVMQYRISLRKSCLLILFQSIFLFKKKLKSHKDNDFYYNCLYHVIVFSIDNVTKKTNSFLFRLQNNYFELQITKLQKKSQVFLKSKIQRYIDRKFST